MKRLGEFVRTPFLSLVAATVVTFVGLSLGCGGGGGGSAQAPAAGAVRPPVQVDGFRPGSGPEGATVILTGRGLNGVTRVLFGPTPAGRLEMIDDQTLSVVVPALAGPGPVRVAVVTGAGTFEAANRFVVQAEPVPVLDPLPVRAVPAGERLVLRGSHFVEPIGIRFGQVPATEFTVDGPNQITVKVPLGATTGPVVVTNPAGPGLPSASLSILPQPAPAGPTVIGLDPVAGPVGSRIHIFGFGFSGVTRVEVGGVATSFTSAGPGELSAPVPAGANTGPVRILTRAGGEAWSPIAFTVQGAPAAVVAALPPVPGAAPLGPAATVANPAPAVVAGPVPPVPVAVPVVSPPVITRLEPAYGLVAARVFIHGSGLARVERVTFNGVPAADLERVSDSRLRVAVPAGATDGPVTVTAAGLTASAPGFKVLERLDPVLTDMEPDHGLAGDPVRVTGRNLLGIEFASFGGTPAEFRSISDTEITVVVPDAAATSRINVRTHRSNTRVITAQPFRVDPLPAPVIEGFIPERAPVGATVQIRGRNFINIRSVKFGRYTASEGTWRVDSRTQITARVPAQAAPGRQPLILVKANGGGEQRVVGAEPFRIAPSPPVVIRVCPAQSRPGMDVILKGSGFTRNSTQVRFNDLPSPRVTRLSREELRARVPEGAVSGPITVLTRQGRCQSAPFGVEHGEPGADVFVDGWYITQGSQDYLGKVPLVAGRSGMLRVFLRANQINHLRPSVTVTLAGGGAAPWVRTIHPQDDQLAVPQAVAEGQMAASWNLAIPGDVLRVGSTLRLVLDPGRLVPHADHSADDRAVPLDVRALPRPRITLVPLVRQGAMGVVNTGGRTLVDWSMALYRLFPLADLPGGLDLQVGPPFESALPLGDDLINALGRERLRRGDEDRIYVGVGPVGGGQPVTGYPDGDLGRLQVVLLSDQPDFRRWFAHEMGHALGLFHAPGAPMNLNTYWPEDRRYENGHLGAYGFDLEAGTLMAPEDYIDIMSYARPNWISDFSYQNVIRFLEACQPFQAP